jgi:hypothetical protein
LEKAENERNFEDFPVIHNPAVFLRKLFERNRQLTVFWQGEKMKTKPFFTSVAVFVFVTGLMPAVFVSTGYATTGINIISQTHHVWGTAGGTLSDSTYDYTSSAPVSGSASALWWEDGSGYTEENPGTNFETSFAGDFHIYARDESCWTFTGSRSFAESTYLFTPQTDQLQIQFTGINGDMYLSRVSFSLFDTITNSMVDSHELPSAYQHFDAVIDWTGNYAVTSGREYALTLYARAIVGDSPYFTCELFANITPEPATLLLLGLGAMMLRRKTA